MKHILIILNIIVYSIVIFACTSLEKRDDKINIKKGEIIVVVQEKYIKQNISNLIAKAYYLKTNKIYKPDTNHQTYVDMIYFGSEYFGIDYKNIIAVITIESEWNSNEYHINRNQTVDYGLCQINSIHIESNYSCAKKICDKYKISYSKDIYDVKLNILSAFIYLNDMRTEMNNENGYSYERWIKSYNVGKNGSISKNYKVSADKYWNKFWNIRSQL